MSSIVRLGTVPASVQHELADQFEAVAVDQQRRWFGQGDLATSVGEFLTLMAARPEARDMLVTLTVEGGVAAGMLVRVPQRDAVDSVFFEVLSVAENGSIAAEARALLDAGEALARERGRRLLGLLQTHRLPSDGDDRLAPNGGGIAIRRDELTDLLIEAGWSLDYTSRHSVMDIREVRLPDAPTADGYQLRVWPQIETPQPFLDDVARMQTAIEADAPNGALDSAAVVWDADRVVRWEQDEFGGSDRLRVVAQHVPSGRLVGYTDVCRETGAEAVFQTGTYVSRDHRGHGLGLAMKTQLISSMRDLWPHAARLHSWNEGSNDPMWRINQALGVRAIDIGATWQKHLDISIDDPTH